MQGLRRWLFVAAGLAALGVLLLGVVLAGAPQVTRTPAPTSTPIGAPTSPPAQTASPIAVAPVPTRVWFARDQLPPIAGEVLGSDPRTAPGGATAERRIDNRLSALWGARPPSVPAGAVNEFARAGRQGNEGRLGLSVAVSGDLATVEFDLGGHGWGVSATAETTGLIQQLVYTITEEPGIRRALIKERGKATLEIGNAILDKPLTREDVFGYAFKGTETLSIVSEGEQLPTTVVRTNVTNDEIPGLGRFTVEVTRGRYVPRLTARLTGPADFDGGRWLLRLDLPDVAAPNPKIPFERFTSGPLTSVDSPHTRGPADVGAIFLLGLDDARPWRVSVEPTTTGTTRITVDVGGRPSLVNKSIAVERADFTPATRTITVRGAARVFEASVSWRMKDQVGKEVARGNTTATVGTSAVWGTFAASAQIPAAVSAGTFEVFWISPRDGAEEDHISVALPVSR